MFDPVVGSNPTTLKYTSLNWSLRTAEPGSCSPQDCLENLKLYYSEDYSMPSRL